MSTEWYTIVGTCDEGEELTSIDDPTGWGRQFDELKALNGLRSDAALAHYLGVSRSFISAVRRGRKTASAELGQKVFDLLGKPIAGEDVEFFKPLRVRLASPLPRSDSHISEAVRARAGGCCELCESAAPFRTPQGIPYLELYHLKPVKKGGKPTPNTVVALCPNCHKKVMVCGTEEDLLKLKKKVEHSGNS